MRGFLIRSLVLATSLLAVGLAPSAPLAAAELAGVTLDDHAEAAGTHLALNGLGLRKKFGFKVYVGGLYIASPSGDADAIMGADGPRRMVMHFVRGVSKKQLCDGWNEGLAANTPSASDAVKKDFETLCGYMEDVSKGDQLVFTYVPGTGTAVEVKGAARAPVEGKAFADALLACWLGPEPPSDDFKDGLLGKQ